MDKLMFELKRQWMGQRECCATARNNEFKEESEVLLRLR